MVFQFTFSGVTYTVAMASGVGGWTLIAQSPSGADDVEIQEAIDYVHGLAITSGKIYIAEGRYSISAPIDIYGSIWICGTGTVGTELQLANGANCNIFQYIGLVAQFWFMLSDMHLHGNRANNPTGGTGLYINPGAESFSDWRVRDVVFMRFRDYGIYSIEGWQSYIHGCTVEHCLGAGICLFQGNMFIDETAFLFNNVGLWLTSGIQFGVHHCIFHHQTTSGVLFETACDYSSLSDCWFVGNGQSAANTYYGLFIDRYADYNIITGCFFDGESQERNGIYIEDGSDSNIITDCRFWDHVTAPIYDGGTDTQLPTISGEFPLSNVGGGAAAVTPVINTSPGGVDIDANDEFTHKRIPLPTKVQQVVRIKIWAYSQVDEVDRMRLRIVAHGATDNETWSGNPIDVPNHPSESVNFSNLDVIYWVIDASDDAQVGTLAAADCVELLACGEVAGDGDCATDALFGGWEVQFV